MRREIISRFGRRSLIIRTAGSGRIADIEIENIAARMTAPRDRTRSRLATLVVFGRDRPKVSRKTRGAITNIMNILTATLTYDFAALEPVLCRDAVRDHLIQHHAAACMEALECVKGTDLERLSLESLIQFTPHLQGRSRVFRRACEIRNHNLYWQSLQPGGGNAPWGLVSARIREDFGTLADFIECVQTQASALVGCGWLWVVWRANRIEVGTTENAQTFPLQGGTVLLALDLWEHAYYHDFRSHRADYVAACFEKLINWDFANMRLRNALLLSKRLRPVGPIRAHNSLITGRGLGGIPLAPRARPEFPAPPRV
jgi:superoxide dismutase, Fe-Mn family